MDKEPRYSDSTDLIKRELANDVSSIVWRRDGEVISKIYRNADKVVAEGLRIHKRGDVCEMTFIYGYVKTTTHK